MRIAKNISHNRRLNETENFTGEELIARQNGALELALEDEIKGLDVVIFHETTQTNVLWHSQILMPMPGSSHVFPTIRISIPNDAKLGKYSAKVLVNETRFSIDFYVIFERHSVLEEKIVIPTGSAALVQTQEFEVSKNSEEFLKLIINDMRGLSICRSAEFIKFLISKNRDRSYNSVFQYSQGNRSCHDCYANSFGSLERVAALVGACFIFGCKSEILCSFHSHNLKKPVVEEFWKAKIYNFYVYLDHLNMVNTEDGTTINYRKNPFQLLFEQPKAVRSNPQNFSIEYEDVTESLLEIKDDNKNLLTTLMNANRGDFKLEITVPPNKHSGKLDGQAVISDAEGNLITILAENFSIAKIPGRKSPVQVGVDIEYKSYEKYLAPGRFIRLGFRYSTSKESRLGFVSLPITDPRPKELKRYFTGAMMSSDGSPLEIVLDPRNIHQRILKPNENIINFQVPFDDKEIIFNKLEDENLTRVSSLDLSTIKFPERKPTRPVTVSCQLSQSISKSITRPNWPLPPPQKKPDQKADSVSSEISSAASLSSITSELTSTMTEDTASTITMPSKLSTFSSHSSVTQKSQKTLSDISSVTDTDCDTESTLTEASVNTIKKQPNPYQFKQQQKQIPAKQQPKPVTYDIMIVPHRHFQDEADSALSSGDLRLIISGTNGRKSNELVVKNRTCSLKDTDAIGKPKEVVIKHSNSDRVWLLDYVCIKSNEYGRQLFPFNDWFDQYSYKLQTREKTRFHVVLSTGKKGMELLREDVQIIISGRSRKSNRWNLGYSNPHPQASQRFNAYETDIFTLTDDDVGKPESIFLWIPQKNKKWSVDAAELRIFRSADACLRNVPDEVVTFKILKPYYKDEFTLYSS